MNVKRTLVSLALTAAFLAPASGALAQPLQEEGGAAIVAKSKHFDRIAQQKKKKQGALTAQKAAAQPCAAVKTPPVAPARVPAEIPEGSPFYRANPGYEVN